MCTRERDLLLAVIERYRDMKYLWDKEHKDYLNKQARYLGFKKLLEIYQVYEQNATIKTLKKKIENLRTTYSREFLKVLKARMAGEEYVPTLWYYNAMSFLDQLKKEQIDQLKLTTTASGSNEITYLQQDIDDNDDSYTPEDAQEIYQVTLSEPAAKRAKVKTEGNGSSSDAPQDDILQGADVDYFSNDAAGSTGNDAAGSSTGSQGTLSFARTLGHQLCELKKDQRIIAEKLISDIIFYGRQDKLEFDSCVTLKPNEF
ncbi:uncharacterized protein LOC105386562 isoform X3 [Plutella xylostella]|uniref:uncharacterized protein LOC105386562 isoform X3 n=1 Tax=Plutella xylostella TaxID=51655 RepID=UPI0020322D58|nr:uncharacterized protein LOC105386562 isoform X3 [Plutella xylostella]